MISNIAKSSKLFSPDCKYILNLFEKNAKAFVIGGAIRDYFISHFFQTKHTNKPKLCSNGFRSC